MKKLIAPFFPLLFMPALLCAQSSKVVCDSIFLRDGTTISAKILTVSDLEVRFEHCPDHSDGKFLLSGASISKIRFAGGSKKIFPEQPGMAGPATVIRQQPARERKKIKPFRFRAGVAISAFLGRKTEEITNQLTAEGFGDRKTHSSNALFGHFLSGYQETFPGFFEDDSPLFLWADGVPWKNLLVGLQARRLSKAWLGYHFLFTLYQNPIDPNDFDSYGHEIGFKTKTTLLEPKVGWINRKQWFAAYAGPSFGNHQVESSTNLGVEPATKHTVGCWGGAEATLRGKRQGLFFCRFFAEYHYVPKLHWASDTVSAQNNGQSYSSQFTGAEVDLSFFTAGIGAGLSF